NEIYCCCIQDSLFRGLNCTEQSAELYFKTRTLSVCVPQQLSECSDTIDFTFDQDKCLLRVMGELRYYRATFKDYSDPDHILDLSVIRSIDDLMQKCFYDTLLDDSHPMTSMEQENSFEGRLKLCKTLKGFQRRPLIENFQESCIWQRHHSDLHRGHHDLLFY
ncbi:uncharacterized protein LOC118242979, partial [Electrophorus electricus]|uniref:uncharacterized protein LOC118242979 n=1 Tax=Electrophorus electricus TaxID=8005 RepID=UPI0015D0692A